MSVADKIKLAMRLTGVTNDEVVQALGVKSNQVLSNKFYRDSFSTDDLIKIASLMGAEWQLVKNGEKIIDFAMIDLNKKE